jgi:hypothetical protein
MYHGNPVPIPSPISSPASSPLAQKAGLQVLHIYDATSTGANAPEINHARDGTVFNKAHLDRMGICVEKAVA